MDVLIPRKWESQITAQGCRILHRYAEALLVSGDTIPEHIPASEIQWLSQTDVFANGLQVAIPDGEFEFGTSPRTLVRFVGPMCAEWRMLLASHFIKVHFWCPPAGACLELPESLRNDKLASTFPFIAGAHPYSQALCTRALKKQSDRFRRDHGLLPNILDVICFSRAQRQEVAEALRKLGVDILGWSSSKLRIRYDKDLTSIRRIRGVKLVDFARVPVLTHVNLVDTVGVNEAVQTTFNLTGAGQVIAVADTGLDTGDTHNLHEDFRGRVRHVVSWPINDSWNPFINNPGTDDGAADIHSGHGTHVAGLALGNGRKSEGKFQGVAPQAELVFQAIEQQTQIKAAYQSQIQSGYYLSGRPLDLRELFLQAKELGTHIHVNAWGDPADGQYTDDCYETDLFLHEHPHSLVMFAAGNAGSDHDGNRELDRGSLYAPASAKNVVAVGATEGGSIGVGLRGTWQAFDQQRSRFRHPGDASDWVSGEPERIALISSTGPTADGRIKPDICAPGTNLAAPRSSKISARGWGLADPVPHYMYNGGTSMSVGVAGGCAALLRQAWQQQNQGQAPSGVALKALLIFGAQTVISRQDAQPEPPHVAGHGRISINHSLPDDNRHITLMDQADQGLNTGELQRVTINMPAEGPFKAVLCWFDYPGERVVNKLNLSLTDQQGNRTWGNQHLSGRNEADRDNTVEVIQFDSLDAGVYTLEVQGSNIPQGPQGYALAFSRASEAGTAALPIETRSLRGIGSRYQSRLQQNGIENLMQLHAIDEAELSTILSARRSVTETLRARLLLLKKTIAAGLTEAIPADTPLADIFWKSPPEYLDQDTWQRVRQQLMPLLLVFNKNSLKHITVQHLFG